MFHFMEWPPTVEGTEIDPAMIRWLAYRVHDDRAINGVAEVAASIIVANVSNPAVIKAIGEKAGRAVAEDGTARTRRSDGECFTYRYDEVAAHLLEGNDQDQYRRLMAEKTTE